MTASDRIVFAVDQLGLQDHHRVLELGCGHGTALALMLERTPHVTGLDRSLKMIDAARRRAPGATLVHGTPHDADGTYDRLLAIHFPPLLRGDDPSDFTRARELLAPGGELHVSFQPLDPGLLHPEIDRVAGALRTHGFTIARTPHDGTTASVVAT